MRRQVFEQVETALALDTHDTVEKGEESSDTRLDKMAKRFLDQKMKDRNFDERKDDKIAAGAAVATENRETVPCGTPEDNVRGSVSSTMKQQRSG